MFAVKLRNFRTGGNTAGQRMNNDEGKGSKSGSLIQ